MKTKVWIGMLLFCVGATIASFMFADIVAPEEGQNILSIILSALGGISAAGIVVSFAGTMWSTCA